MKTLLLGTTLLAAVLVACGGGASPALKAVKEDCQSPYSDVGAYVCRKALLDGAYTGTNEHVTKVECLMLEATRRDYWDAGYIGLPGRVSDLYEELCEDGVK